MHQSPQYESDFSSFGSPGTPPLDSAYDFEISESPNSPYPSLTSDLESVTNVAISGDNYKSVTLEEELHEAREKMQYYSQKVKEQEHAIEDLREHFIETVHRVRDFWKNKIYLEGCRSGKILKMSMQKTGKN